MPVDVASDRGQVQNGAPGRVESGVLAEIALLGDHGRPGIEAGAVTLARLLDNPLAYTSHASAARVLSRLLDELHKSQRAPWGPAGRRADDEPAGWVRRGLIRPLR